MSENQNNIKSEAEESSIFSAPTEHIDKGKKSKNSLLKRITAAVLAVIILASGTVLVVKLIPEKTTEQVEVDQGYAILNVPQNEIKKVTVTHEAGSLVILSSVEYNEQSFILEGYDNTLIDAASLEQIVGYVSSMKAFGEYAIENSVDYGLDEPLVTVEVEGQKSEQKYTVTFGKNTGDNTYTYVMLSSAPEKVYLIQKGIVSGLMVAPLDLAISTVIPAVSKNDKNAAYFDSSGTLTTFDSLTISGGNFKTPIVFKPNNDKLINEYATYICTSPLLRMANGVEEVFAIFANGLTSSSAVSFDQSAENIKKFGLDNPKWVITMTVAGEKYTYKITPTDETLVDFFVASSTDRMIRTVPLSSLPFINKTEHEFYFGFMVVESIKTISEFNLSGEVNASFALSYDEDNEEYNIKKDGQKINAEDFQSFYAEFVQTTAIDFNTVKTTAKPSLTLTIKHNDGTTDTVLTFTKISETRYQYTAGGKAMGQIPTTAYNRIVKQLNKIVP